MPTTRQFVLLLVGAVVCAFVTAALAIPVAWIAGAIGGALALVFVMLFRDDPRARRPGPAVLGVTTFLLSELVLVLHVVGQPLRGWMVAALVLATLTASAMVLFTQGRERRQIAMYIAIGLPVILVLAVLLFLALDAPFF